METLRSIRHTLTPYVVDWSPRTPPSGTSDQDGLSICRAESVEKSKSGILLLLWNEKVKDGNNTANYRILEFTCLILENSTSRRSQKGWANLFRWRRVKGFTRADNHGWELHACPCSIFHNFRSNSSQPTKAASVVGPLCITKIRQERYLRDTSSVSIASKCDRSTHFPAVRRNVGLWRWIW